MEWTGSLGGGGRVSGVNVGGAADAASGGFCHNWLLKKNGRGSGNCCYRSRHRGFFQKLSKKKRRKDQWVVIVAIAKESGSLKLRSGADVLQLRH